MARESFATAVVERRNCFLQESITQYWSDRDALGCMTLHTGGSTTASAEADWQQMVSLMDRLGAPSRDVVVGRS